MGSKFHLYLKSSIDHKAVQIANTLGIPVVDLDSSGLVAELLESDAPAVVWAMGNLTEAPMDPLWFLDFDIGAKTSHDPAQYKSMDITGVLADAFRVGTTIQVRDYTGDTPGTEVHGEVIINGVAASPSQPDRLSGVRLINVQARAVRYS